MSARHRHGTGWRGAAVAGMALVAVAGILGACGSSSSSTTTTGASGTTATTGSGSGDASSRLDALTGNVQAAQKSSFQAVYTSTSGGSTSTVTLAQAPPKQLFSTADSSGSTTSLINTGTTTYTCTGGGGGGTATCTSIGGGLAGSALSGLINVYNGSAALTVLKGWQSTLAAHIAGASLTFTDETIAGQPSTCAHWSHSGDTATYCVTSSGVLAKVESGSSSGGSSFTLTSYTSSPPASTFTTPQGATVVTLPSGVSVP